MRFGDELERLSPRRLGGMGDGSLEECEDKLPEKRQKNLTIITCVLEIRNYFSAVA
jgi:hypothetical protein